METTNIQRLKTEVGVGILSRSNEKEKETELRSSIKAFQKKEGEYYYILIK